MLHGRNYNNFLPIQWIDSGTWILSLYQLHVLVKHNRTLRKAIHIKNRTTKLVHLETLLCNKSNSNRI